MKITKAKEGKSPFKTPLSQGVQSKNPIKKFNPGSLAKESKLLRAAMNVIGIDQKRNKMTISTYMTAPLMNLDGLEIYNDVHLKPRGSGAGEVCSTKGSTA